VAPCDVTDRDAIRRVVADTIASFGSIDILFNNAGVNTPRRALRELSWEDWRTLIDVNLHGSYLCVEAVLPHMRRQGAGTLVHSGSYAAHRPGTIAGAAYSAAKAGLASLSDVINVEERRFGIRSTLLTIAEVNTPILDSRPDPPPAEARARALQPEDIAACVVFACTLPSSVVIEQMVIAPTLRG
jgi:NADP-dependent 3-hydroxy acid dehydrogenase YdfG